MPKKTRTNSKKIRSSISFAPNRQRRPFIKRTYQAATPKEPSTNAKKRRTAILERIANYHRRDRKKEAKRLRASSPLDWPKFNSAWSNSRRASSRA